MITLHLQTLVVAPPERCFDLARSAEVHAASAGPIQGQAVAGRTAGLSEPGDWTTWTARFFGMRFMLTTQITEFDRPHCFSDVMCAGLFAHFGHNYTFKQISETQTLLTDVLTFQSPAGILGATFDRLVLRRRMKNIAEHRLQYLKRGAESDLWHEYLPEMRGVKGEA